MNTDKVLKGQIRTADFSHDLFIGCEYRKTRDVVVISNDKLNYDSDLVMVVLCTTQSKGGKGRVSLCNGKLEANCQHIRTISKQRLGKLRYTLTKTELSCVIKEVIDIIES